MSCILFPNHYPKRRRTTATTKWLRLELSKWQSLSSSISRQALHDWSFSLIHLFLFETIPGSELLFYNGSRIPSAQRMSPRWQSFSADRVPGSFQSLVRDFRYRWFWGHPAIAHTTPRRIPSQPASAGLIASKRALNANGLRTQPSCGFVYNLINLYPHLIGNLNVHENVSFFVFTCIIF